MIHKLLTAVLIGLCCFVFLLSNLAWPSHCLHLCAQVSFWRRKIPKPEWTNSGGTALFCAAAGQSALQHPTGSSTEGEFSCCHCIITVMNSRLKKIFQCFFNVLRPTFCFMKNMNCTLITGVASSVVRSTELWLRLRLYVISTVAHYCCCCYCWT